MFLVLVLVCQLIIIPREIKIKLEYSHYCAQLIQRGHALGGPSAPLSECQPLLPPPAVPVKEAINFVAALVRAAKKVSRNKTIVQECVWGQDPVNLSNKMKHQNF